MSFIDYSKKVTEQINHMSKSELFVVDISKDTLWNLYQDSFPEGTNEIHVERRQHDCSCCKQFFKNMCNVVSIVDGKLISIWDVETLEPYQTVTDILSKAVRDAEIVGPFLSVFKKHGAEHTIQHLENGNIINWDHFNCELSDKFYNENKTTVLSGIQSSVHVFKRGLEEISIDALNIVLDLIMQGSLYRGEEHLKATQDFAKLHSKYWLLAGSHNNFIWSNYKSSSIRFRNTVIGTLVSDLSEGVDLEKAVGMFESKVAPENYKRSSALITQSMIKDAVIKLDSLGLRDATERRFAVLGDVSTNNVLFVDRAASDLMKDPLIAMLEPAAKKPKSFSKVEDIAIEDFINNVLPEITSMSVLFENRHKSNMVSLIAPQHNTQSLFKWDNNVSWNYKGNVTDSIKERVKAAGGAVEGYARTSLSWFNFDDLDIHVIEPNGNEIYYSNKCGKLDVDMNAGGSSSREAVENIVWKNKSDMQIGAYSVVIHNYQKRESVDVGFVLQTEFNDVIEEYSYTLVVGDNKKIPVIEFNFDGNNITTSQVHKNIVKGSSSSTEWGIATQDFHKVSTMMLSPNYWDDNKNGNKHYMFMLDKCINDERPRGIFNEYLRSELTPHRKVFEVLASKTLCENSEEQLSGLGFSSTKKAELTVKVEGNFNRMLNIIF